MLHGVPCPCLSHVHAMLQVLVPPLRELESYIFESIFRHLWARCLIDSITNDPHMLSHTTHSHLALHKASAHEDAIRRWLDALQVGRLCFVCSLLHVAVLIEQCSVWFLHSQAWELLLCGRGPCA